MVRSHSNEENRCKIYYRKTQINFRCIWVSGWNSVGKISKSVYVVSVNGTSKSAHIRQLKKTKAKNIENWPGTFEHKNCENKNKTQNDKNCDIESNVIELDSDHSTMNKKRSRSPNEIEFDARRSRRLAALPRLNYKECRITKR